MFDGDQELRGADEIFELDAHQIQEYIKCQNDTIYFIENYIYIDSSWSGQPQVIQFKPEPYQKDLILSLHNGRFVIGKLSRQVGKSTALNAYIVWCVNFI